MNAPISNSGVKKAPYNNVYDWNSLQGYSFPGEESFHTQRNINFRHISVENATDKPIGISIASYETLNKTLTTKPQFYLSPGESKDLAINEFLINKPPSQIIHIYYNNKDIGISAIVRSDANVFVIREAYHNLFVHRYYRPTFKAS